MLGGGEGMRGRGDTRSPGKGVPQRERSRLLENDPGVPHGGGPQREAPDLSLGKTLRWTEGASRSCVERERYRLVLRVHAKGEDGRCVVLLTWEVLSVPSRAFVLPTLTPRSPPGADAPCQGLLRTGANMGAEGHPLRRGPEGLRAHLPLSFVRVEAGRCLPEGRIQGAASWMGRSSLLRGRMAGI